MSEGRFLRERLASAARAPGEAVGPAAQAPTKTRAAAVSIVSNSILIVLKLIAGAITGSIAIVTEAVHSSIDLMASIVAYFSVRKADEPADDSHPYGHQKVENMAAALEGMLILVGAAIIVYEATRRLFDGSPVDSLGFGIAVIGFSAVALAVAAAIVFAGVRILTRSSRVLVDEALPPEELDSVRNAIEGHGAEELIGFHKLRARRAGSRRYVDLHVQFRNGTTLKRAHEISHELEGRIRERVRGADVLIHLEPEESARPPVR